MRSSIATCSSSLFRRAYNVATQKYALAKQWGIPVVTAEWLSASLAAGQRQPESEYPPLELKRTFVFGGSARPEESDLATLTGMGADVSAVDGSTHLEGAILIMKKLHRSGRFLCACAAGSW